VIPDTHPGRRREMSDMLKGALLDMVGY